MNLLPKMLQGCAALLGLLLCSCAVDTPLSRIERNPGAFEALNPRQQALVEAGRIEKGMPKSGVLLALGSPDRRGEGFRDGASFERWDYTSLRPVYTNSFYGSYGYGGWGHHGCRGYGYGFAPSVEYIPQRSASVWFRNAKVDSYERLYP